MYELYHARANAAVYQQYPLYDPKNCGNWGYQRQEIRLPHVCACWWKWISIMVAARKKLKEAPCLLWLWTVDKMSASVIPLLKDSNITCQGLRTVDLIAGTANTSLDTRRSTVCIHAGVTSPCQFKWQVRPEVGSKGNLDMILRANYAVC